MTSEEIAVSAFQTLAEVAVNQETITYGELGKRVGVHHRATFLPLGYLWGWCQDRGYPHLNALVVNKSTGVPGHAYAPDGTPLKRKQWRRIVCGVHRFDWLAIAPYPG